MDCQTITLNDLLFIVSLVGFTIAAGQFAALMTTVVGDYLYWRKHGPSVRAMRKRILELQVEQDAIVHRARVEALQFARDQYEKAMA